MDGPDSKSGNSPTPAVESRTGSVRFPSIDHAEAAAVDLPSVVSKLCSRDDFPDQRLRKNPCNQPLPSRNVVLALVEDLRSTLFPGYFGNAELSEESLQFHVGSTLDRVQRLMHEQVKRGLCFMCEELAICDDCDRRVDDVVRTFLGRLPEIRRRLDLDVLAHFKGDPAAMSLDEAIFCYPGMTAVTNYRLAHELYKLGVPLLPRMITEHAHSVTGIDIHPGAEIGRSFFVDHGTGVVIGETCRIGDNVKIYQGVTLGAKSFPLDEEGKPIKGVHRHPTVEDDVIIYSGATILGPVVIGRGSVIGGNVWLTRSVPPGSRITQAQVREDIFEDGGGI